jgi:hypothetical protein
MSHTPRIAVFGRHDTKAIFTRTLDGKLSVRVTRKIPPRVSVVRDECICIHELGDPFGHAIGDTGDHHSRVAMAAEDDLRELLVDEHVGDVVDVRVEIDRAAS